MQKRTVRVSQNEMIKQYLEKNSGITKEEARQKLSVQNLRARIDELRKSGMDIQTSKTPEGTTRWSAGQPPQPENIAPSVPSIASDMKQQFVDAIKQVLEEKGLMLEKQTSKNTLGSRLESKGKDIKDAIDNDPDTSSALGKFEAAINSLHDNLKRQVDATEILSGVIKKSAENVQRAGEINRVQDVRRNMGLIDAAKELRKELSGKAIAGKANSDIIRPTKTRRDEILKTATINLMDAKINISDSAKLNLIGPQTKPRSSGIDDEQVQLGSSDRGSSGINPSGILRGLMAAGVGALAVKFLMSDEVKEKLADQIGAVFKGAVEKASKGLGDYIAEQTTDSVATAIKNNPTLSAYSIANLSKGAVKLGGGLAKGVKGISGAVARVGSAMTGSAMTGARAVSGAAGAAAGAARFAAKGTPLVGAAIDFGARKAAGQTFGQAAFGTAAGAAGGLVGNVGGTLAGGPIGGIAGGVVGATAAGTLADGIYRNFSGSGTIANTTTDNNLQNMNGGIPWTSQLGSNSDDVGSRPVDPKTASDYIYNYFTQKGFTPEQTAGIIGNMIKETSNFTDLYNPDDKTASGKSMGPSSGLVQWNGPRIVEFKRFSGGMEPHRAPIKTQLDFIIHEFENGEANALRQLKKAKTPAQAALAFEESYERPAKNPEGSKARQDAANMVFERMKKRQFSQVVPKSVGEFNQPNAKNAVIPKSSSPLKDIESSFEEMSSPTIIMPQTTNIVSPQATQSPQVSGGSQVLTVRDTTTSFTRNADKHTGFRFAR